MGFIGSGLGLAVFFGLFVVFKWINILNEYERGVIFRLGRVLKESKGPGFVFVFWPIDRMVKISLRTVVLATAAGVVVLGAILAWRRVPLLDRLVLDQHHALVLVEVEGRYLVLGVGAAGGWGWSSARTRPFSTRRCCRSPRKLSRLSSGPWRNAASNARYS